VARADVVSLTRRPLSEQVAASIVEFCVSREMKANDVVPTIADLAETLQVSRTVVRDALTRLEEEGVVSQGEGRFWVLLGPGLRRWQRSRGRVVRSESGGEANAALNYPSLAERAADAVLDMILDQKLQEGDPLPPNWQLAEDYGVSTLVVREAIASLAARGILLRRQGREPVVSAPRFEIISSMLRVRAHLDGITIDEFRACRAGLEIQAAALAAKAGNPARKAQVLQQYLDGMREAPDAATFNENDMGFHLAVAELSDNQAVQIMLQAVGDLLREGIEESYRRDFLRGGREGLVEIHKLHEGIAEAISKGDSAAASERMAVHFHS
jgi:DNA-binding FadR family transcriptional regulator